MSRSIASVSFVRFALTLGLTAAAAIGAVPACSSGEDFTSKNTGGTSNTGGTAGDASTTGGAGGAGGSGGSSGTSTGGVAGTGTGGVAGTGTGGVAGTGTGGVAGSASGGTGGNPGGKANGATCALESECQSNYCVDGVCCESDCKGVCKTCSESGKEGLCTPYTKGLDPEADCVGAGAPTDPCAGKCDDKGACTFPSSSLACGAAVCTSGVANTFACDAAGACKKAEKQCGNFVCSGAVCLTSCSKDADCISTTYCENPVCTPKKALGGICPGDSACLSGHCFGGNCCSSATCATNFTCESGGCQCNGQTCDAGQACVPWYRDFDGDGFGNPLLPTLGCANKKPVGYVADKTDCWDQNIDAKPGQTQYFSKDRGDGSYDYNCDNTQQPLYPVINSAACKFCTSSPLCNLTSCKQQASFVCSGLGCPLAPTGFDVDPGCGKPGTLKTCNATIDINANCTGGVSVTSATGTPQMCR